MKKKLLNIPEEAVTEMMEGLAAAHPDRLKKLEEHNVVIRKDAPFAKVALISGGGSGHEPAHGGYVGQGMLDAAVSGDVFTSPTPDPVLAAIRSVAGGKGVLLIVKNYTGDVMNFDMAADMAAAEGIEVEQVVVNDDVAVEEEDDRRGVAGTVFVHKIAGALAEQGGSLVEVKAMAEKVIGRVKSKGVALYPCRVPAADEPTFTLAEDEMELGIGIHGEAGTRKVKLEQADEIVAELLTDIIKDLPFTSGDDVAVLVNGMGGTPLLELMVVNRAVQNFLDKKDINIYKTFVGEYMTSLEMAGVSLSLLKLDEELKCLLQAPTEIPLLS